MWESSSSEPPNEDLLGSLTDIDGSGGGVAIGRERGVGEWFGGQGKGLGELILY